MAALAQFIDKGKYVEVKKRAILYSNIKMEKAKGALDPEKAFWQVTSNGRANDAQTVTAIKEHRYDEDYATFF